MTPMCDVSSIYSPVHLLILFISDDALYPVSSLHIILDEPDTCRWIYFYIQAEWHADLKEQERLYILLFISYF